MSDGGGDLYEPYGDEVRVSQAVSDRFAQVYVQLLLLGTNVQVVLATCNLRDSCSSDSRLRRCDRALPVSGTAQQMIALKALQATISRNNTRAH